MKKKLKRFTPPKLNSNKIYLKRNIKKIISLIKKSSRPVVLLGGGIKIAKVQEKINNFIKKLMFQLLLLGAELMLLIIITKTILEM